MISNPPDPIKSIRRHVDLVAADAVKPRPSVEGPGVVRRR
jgi:hypothetical protein